MSRRKINKSNEWRRRQEKDPHTQAARKQGYRSRAAMKLIEIDDQKKIFFAGATVVDLGSAPGGWSQVAARRIGKKGRIVAVDILPMANIDGVSFIQGDFTFPQTALEVERQTDGGVDIVLSDMSPNITGIAVTDQFQSEQLTQAAFDFAAQRLAAGGCFLVKIFQGEKAHNLQKMIENRFSSLCIMRLQTTRKTSREIYFVATGVKKD